MSITEAAYGLQLYGVPLNEAEADRLQFNRRLDLAHSAATLLDKNNLVKYDRRTGNLQVRLCLLP